MRRARSSGSVWFCLESLYEPKALACSANICSAEIPPLPSASLWNPSSEGPGFLNDQTTPVEERNVMVCHAHTRIIVFKSESTGRKIKLQCCRATKQHTLEIFYWVTAMTLANLVIIIFLRRPRARPAVGKRARSLKTSSLISLRGRQRSRKSTMIPRQ